MFNNRIDNTLHESHYNLTHHVMQGILYVLIVFFYNFKKGENYFWRTKSCQNDKVIRHTTDSCVCVRARRMIYTRWEREMKYVQANAMIPFIPCNPIKNLYMLQIVINNNPSLIQLIHNTDIFYVIVIKTVMSFSKMESRQPSVLIFSVKG